MHVQSTDIEKTLMAFSTGLRQTWKRQWEGLCINECFQVQHIYCYADYSRPENHHLISNKRERSGSLKDILKQNNYSLNDSSNIVSLENHRGRHSDAYHDFISNVIDRLGAYSNGSYDLFVKGMKVLGEFIKEYPWLPYAQPKNNIEKKAKVCLKENR